MKDIESTVELEAARKQFWLILRKHFVDEDSIQSAWDRYKAFTWPFTVAAEKAEDVTIHGKEQEDTYTAPSGVTRSRKMPPYHMIPTEALDCMAERFGLGFEKKKEKSFQSRRYTHMAEVLKDDEFFQDALNHMQKHLSLLMNKDFREDEAWGHLGAILWGAAVHAWRLKNREGK